jgi:Arabinose efflux permease
VAAPRRVTAAGMCAFFTMYLTQGLLPSLQSVFHASVAELSLTITFTTLAVAVAAPFSGIAADRFGRKRVLLVSLAGLGLSTLLAATATSLHGLLVWRAIEGLCIPGVFTATVAYISEEWPPSEVPAVTALYISGSVAGGFSGRFIAGMVTRMRAGRGFCGAGCNQSAVSALDCARLAGLAPVCGSRGGVRAALSGFALHLRNPKLLGTYAIGFGILFSQVCTFTYVSFHLAAPPYGFDLKDLSLLFTVYLVGMVATPLAGKLAWKFGKRRVFVAAVALGSGGMLLTLLSPVWAIVLGLTLSSGGVFIAQSMARRRCPRWRARRGQPPLGCMCCATTSAAASALSARPGSGRMRVGPGCVALVLIAQLAIGVAAWRIWATPAAR